AGVAFVRVADDVLGGACGLGDRVPLEPRRVAGPAAAAEATPGDLVPDLARRHRAEPRPKRLVATTLDVIVEALGIDAARVLRGDADLPAEERRLRLLIGARH